MRFIFPGLSGYATIKAHGFVCLRECLTKRKVMSCCGTHDIDPKKGTFEAKNSISILAKGYPIMVTKTSFKNNLTVEYTTDMELDADEKKALHELLSAIDSQKGPGCCRCCCPSDEDYQKIMRKVEEMHMAYQIDQCCYRVNMVLLTKTGNVVPATPSKESSTEVPHGVMLFPGLPLIVTRRILSDNERREVSTLHNIGKDQWCNMSKSELLTTCLLTGISSVGLALVATGCIMCFMMCCNCNSYKTLKHNLLSTGTERKVFILEECCWTVNTVEYRNFAYPVHRFEPNSSVGIMER